MLKERLLSRDLGMNSATRPGISTSTTRRTIAATVDASAKPPPGDPIISPNAERIKNGVRKIISGAKNTATARRLVSGLLKNDQIEMGTPLRRGTKITIRRYNPPQPRIGPKVSGNIQ
jgi:hypothetical protein